MTLAPHGWEPVIGLEVHAQLLTASKLFCPCRTSFGAPPNTHVCPTCLGLPGALPVLNAEAARMAVKAALALDCQVRTRSRFARKNYFYPDSPKGYQISQFDEPFSDHGHLDIAVGTEAVPVTKRARILRIHMEEDAGKTIHDLGGASIVDLNRAGVPLVEIVGEPDLRSAQEAAEYLRTLREILVFLGINDGNLEEGSFRCDANVSIRPVGTETLGTRVELKNINSFKFVERAITIEIERQKEVLEGGGRITHETRGWDEKNGTTFSLRSKEAAQDYRYFPEPDVPPMIFDDVFVERARAELPELPRVKRERFVRELGLTRCRSSRSIRAWPRSSRRRRHCISTPRTPRTSQTSSRARSCGTSPRRASRPRSPSRRSRSRSSSAWSTAERSAASRPRRSTRP